MAHDPSGADDTPTVLHVDDNPLILELSAILLDRAGFEVQTANSVGTAIDRLAGGEFDCVVTDYDMPPSDATVLLDAESIRDGDLPVVLFTATDPVQLGADGVLSRVDEFLRKDDGSDQFGVLADLVRTAISRAEDAPQAAPEATT